MTLLPALLALVASAALAQPQPPATERAPSPPPQQPQAPLSERQQERIAQQERLIACNKQAREAGMRSSQRQEFIRDCLKGDNAAAGGGGRER